MKNLFWCIESERCPSDLLSSHHVLILWYSFMPRAKHTHSNWYSSYREQLWNSIPCTSSPWINYLTLHKFSQMLRVTLRIALRILSVEEECARKEREMAWGLREAVQVQQTTQNEDKDKNCMLMQSMCTHIFTSKLPIWCLHLIQSFIYKNALNRWK